MEIFYWQELKYEICFIFSSLKIAHCQCIVQNILAVSWHLRSRLQHVFTATGYLICHCSVKGNAWRDIAWWGIWGHGDVYIYAMVTYYLIFIGENLGYMGTCEKVSKLIFCRVQNILGLANFRTYFEQNWRIICDLSYLMEITSRTWKLNGKLQKEWALLHTNP